MLNHEDSSNVEETSIMISIFYFDIWTSFALSLFPLRTKTATFCRVQRISSKISKETPSLANFWSSDSLGLFPHKEFFHVKICFYNHLTVFCSFSALLSSMWCLNNDLFSQVFTITLFSNSVHRHLTARSFRRLVPTLFLLFWKPFVLFKHRIS